MLQAEAKHIDLQVPLMVGVFFVGMRCQKGKNPENVPMEGLMTFCWNPMCGLREVA